MKTTKTNITNVVSRYGKLQITEWPAELANDEVDIPDDLIFKLSAKHVPTFTNYYFLYPTRKGYNYFRPWYIEALKKENRYNITIEILDKTAEDFFIEVEKHSAPRVKNLRRQADKIEKATIEALNE
jgi:hypothetical protein